MGFQNTFKAISDPTRRDILQLLKTGRKTAGEIGEAFKTTGATISHHLSVLKEAGLVDDEKVGKYIYYQINTTVLEEILTWAMALMEDNSDDK